MRSEEQDVDIFTKPLGIIKHADNRTRIAVEKIRNVDQDLTNRGGIE